VLYSRLFFQRRSRTIEHFLTISQFAAGETQKILNIDGEKITVTHLEHDNKIFYPRSPEEVRAGKFSWEKTARATFQTFLEVPNG